ncbi:hypothetical protein Q7P35_010696 [Cladosporium inversicolor]
MLEARFETPYHTPSINSPRGIATKSLETNKPLEEERLPGYEPEQFYPVNTGDTINSRYHVIGKLGFGANSTVWFCRDLSNNKYIVLKMCVRTPPGKVNREISFYNHLDTLTTSHPGSQHIRRVIDMFSLQCTNGDVHECLVHQPLQTTLFAFQRPGGTPRPFPEGLVKMIMKNLLEALDFLHTEANVTHCDLKLSNIMFSVGDDSVFKDYEEAQASSPSQSKIVDHFRRVSHRKDHAHMDIQPEIYKAPEVLMETEWTHALWEMVEAKHLFDGYDEEGFHNYRCHMREIVCLLGEPPSIFLQRSLHTWRLFDDNGKWKAQPPLCAVPLVVRLTQLHGQDRDEFLDFMTSLLRWLPETRLTAQQILEHPWQEGIDSDFNQPP